MFKMFAGKFIKSRHKKTPSAKASFLDNSIFEDSISAIVNLGYSRSDAYKAINLIKDEFKNSKNDDKISIEKIVPLALKKLSS